MSARMPGKARVARWTIDSATGIRRVTLPLPTRPGHVHAYPLPGADGWDLVDTGVGLLTRRDVGRGASSQAGGRGRDASSSRTFIPTTSAAAAGSPRARLAPWSCRARSDYAQCELVWGNSRLVGAIARLVPAPRCGRTTSRRRARRPELRATAPSSAISANPILVEAGSESTAGSSSPHPGHADGQLCLLRDGVLVAADHLLGRITPTVGLWPAEPRPIRWVTTSRRSTETIELSAGDCAARSTGTDRVIRSDVHRSCRNTTAVRLGEAVAALGAEPQHRP